MLVARAVPNARIAVPGHGAATRSRRIAEPLGATIIRTRSDRRSLMALAAEAGKGSLAFAGGANYELIFPEFQPVFDSLYAAAKIMELIAAQGAASARSSTNCRTGTWRRVATTVLGNARARSCAGFSAKPTANRSN